MLVWEVTRKASRCTWSQQRRSAESIRNGYIRRNETWEDSAEAKVTSFTTVVIEQSCRRDAAGRDQVRRWWSKQAGRGQVGRWRRRSEKDRRGRSALADNLCQHLSQVEHLVRGGDRAMCSQRGIRVRRLPCLCSGRLQSHPVGRNDLSEKKRGTIRLRRCLCCNLRVILDSSTYWYNH